MIEHINGKRKALGLAPMMYEPAEPAAERELAPAK